MTNPAKSTATRKRLRSVEEMMLNGHKAQEIHDRLGNQFGVTYGTIRNDIVKINKAHRADISAATELQGRGRYLAAVRQIRRKAMNGWRERDQFGVERIKGRDFKLAHHMDQEIARGYGVELKQDNRTITLNMEKARGYLDSIFAVVFKHIQDDEIRQKIVDDLQKLDDAE